MNLSLDLLIPTYNRAGLLNLCLESVMKARIPSGLKVTVYIVDNNSTDGTSEIAKSFPFQYLFVPRPGKSAAINEALSQSDSQLVGFIDDDEQIDPSWFEVVYREFIDSSDLGFIGGPYLGNFESPQPDWTPDRYSGAIGANDKAVYTIRQPYCVGKTGMLMGGNSVIRRYALNQVLPYPETLGKIGNVIRSGEDEVIYHRLLKAGIKGMYVPDLVIYHWIPSARMSKKYYRKWVLGRGIAQGAQLKHRTFTEASLFGVPRYRFGVALKALYRLCSRSDRERFAAQLDIIDCFAVLYGFHFESLKVSDHQTTAVTSDNEVAART